MLNIKDVEPGFVVFAADQAANVKAGTFIPGFESRRSKKIIDLKRQIEALFWRIDFVNGKCSQRIKRRIINSVDEIYQCYIFPECPVKFNNIGKQDVFLALEWIDVVVSDHP